MSRTVSDAPEAPVDEDTAVVLAAVDTSSMSSRVVDLATRLARRTWTSAQLHLVHVARLGRFDRPAQAGYTVDELLADASAHLDYYVRVARKQSGAVAVTGHLAKGDPVDEIVRLARTLLADVLVVGTHDTAGLERLLLGSVAEKVARTAPCPVFVVRAKQRPFTKVG
jgi:nucleotide-binding universal stress UspA family protein